MRASEFKNILILANGSCDQIYSTGSTPSVYNRRGGFFGKIIYVHENFRADESTNEKIHLSKKMLIDEFSYKSEILIIGDERIEAEFKCLKDEAKLSRRYVDKYPLEPMVLPMGSQNRLPEFSSTNTGLAEKNDNV